MYSRKENKDAGDAAPWGHGPSTSLMFSFQHVTIFFVIFLPMGTARAIDSGGYFKAKTATTIYGDRHFLKFTGGPTAGGAEKRKIAYQQTT